MDDHKSFEEILRETNQNLPPAEEDATPEPEAFPMMDAVDKEILMHRDVHFGGQFSIMLDYYAVEGKGVNPEFDVKRIEELAKIEQEVKENLAPLLLTGSDAEVIARAKQAYKDLRDLYDQKNPKSKLPLLIADLILSEEEEAESEVEAIVKEKKVIIPLLLDLLKSSDFHSSLFPGYGHAPFLAAKCLGLIGDERASFSLFESLGDGDFGDEKMVLRALTHIGDPARDFLLKVIASTPACEDNERAALALIAFQGDDVVSEAVLSLLERPDIFQHESFAAYLILICEGLSQQEHKDRFAALLMRDDIPKELRLDIETIHNG